MPIKWPIRACRLAGDKIRRATSKSVQNFHFLFSLSLLSSLLSSLLLSSPLLSSPLLSPLLSSLSPKFHTFLKFALTKNEKKRPTAAALLQSEFTSQPHLSRQLTLMLLQQNRNPEPLNLGRRIPGPEDGRGGRTPVPARQAAPDTAAAVKRSNAAAFGAAAAAASAVQSRPSAANMPLRVRQVRFLSFFPSTRRLRYSTVEEIEMTTDPSLVDAGQQPASSKSAHHPVGFLGVAVISIRINLFSRPCLSTSHADPTSVIFKKATCPPATRFPFSSAGMEAASKYVATHTELGDELMLSSSSPAGRGPHAPIPTNKPTVPSEMQTHVNGAETTECQSHVPAERIPPKRTVTTAGNKNPSKGIYPRFPVRSRIEEVRIMDEVATPLPAYTAFGPTATPAPKLPTSTNGLLNSPPSPAAAAVAAAVVAKPLDGGPKVTPAPLSPTYSRSSASSASTSPCSTISSSSRADSEEYAVSSSPSAVSSEDEDEEDEETGRLTEIEVSSHSPKVSRTEASYSSGPDTNAGEVVLEDRTAVSATIKVDPEGEKSHDRPDPVEDLCEISQGTLIMHRTLSTNDGDYTREQTESAVSAKTPVGTLERAPDSHHHHHHSLATEMMQMNGLRGSLIRCQHSDKSSRGSDRADILPSADIDLDVADEELLAADGVLVLGKTSRPESLGDRISEFGFRMHGTPDEDEEEEDIDYDRLDEILAEGGLTSPQLEDRNLSVETTVGTPLAFRAQRDQPALTQSREILNGDIYGSKTPMTDARPCSRRGKPDIKLIRKTRQQASAALPTSPTDSAGSSTSTTEEKPSTDFFPDKSGAELIDVLRQLKFAQKYAWLVGEPTVPLGLSNFNPGSAPSLSASVPTRNVSSPVLPARNNPSPPAQQKPSQLAVFPLTEDTKTCPISTSEADTAASAAAAAATADDDDDGRADLSARPKISAPAFLSNGVNWPLLQPSAVVKHSPCPLNSSSSTGTMTAVATALASTGSLLSAPSVPTLAASPLASPLQSVHNLVESTNQAELPTISAGDVARLSLPNSNVLFSVSSSSSDLHIKDSSSSNSDKQQDQQQHQQKPQQPSQEVEFVPEFVRFELQEPTGLAVPAQIVETITINSSTGNHSLESLDRSNAHATAVAACPTKYALTSPCCMSTAREAIGFPTSSVPSRTIEPNQVLRQIVEEHLESKLPPGEAPLAGLEEDELAPEDLHAWEDVGTDNPPGSAVDAVHPVLKEMAEPVQAPVDEDELPTQATTPLKVVPPRVQTTRKVCYRDPASTNHAWLYLAAAARRRDGVAFSTIAPFGHVIRKKVIYHRLILSKPGTQDRPILRRNTTFSGLSDLPNQCPKESAYHSCPELSLEFSKPVPTDNLRSLGHVSASAPSLKEAELAEPSTAAAEGSSVVEMTSAEFSCRRPAPIDSLSAKVSQSNGLTPALKAVSTTQAGRIPRQDSADVVLSSPTFSHQPVIKSGFSPQPSALLRRLRPDRRFGKMSRPASGVIATKSSSEFEKSRQRWLAHQSTTALPPTPQVLVSRLKPIVGFFYNGRRIGGRAWMQWVLCIFKF
ncbi:unnamed protein product [Schistocephalus solidus]|uniref:Mucin-5AC n=1 Tax=Schistocephalus solidus TaxID=70667 RepID=A0A183SPT8_SCHSO|nr:unnamed protein product [Schistocephalus solidus]